MNRRHWPICRTRVHFGAVCKKRAKNAIPYSGTTRVGGGPRRIAHERDCRSASRTLSVPRTGTLLAFADARTPRDLARRLELQRAYVAAVRAIALALAGAAGAAACVGQARVRHHLRAHRPVAPFVEHRLPSGAPVGQTNETRTSVSLQVIVSVPVTTRMPAATPAGPGGPTSPLGPGVPGGPAVPCGP